MDVGLFEDRKYNNKFVKRNNSKKGSKKRVKGTVKTPNFSFQLRLGIRADAQCFIVNPNHLKLENNGQRRTITLPGSNETFFSNIEYSNNKNKRWKLTEDARKNNSLFEKKDNLLFSRSRSFLKTEEEDKKISLKELEIEHENIIKNKEKKKRFEGLTKGEQKRQRERMKKKNSKQRMKGKMKRKKEKRICNQCKSKKSKNLRRNL